MRLRSLIFGGRGMLGRALTRECRHREWPVLALSRDQADITDPDRLELYFESFRPQVVFNAAAFTKVDECETRRELAREVNGHAVGHLARLADHYDASLIHVSTDYVFDGQGREPYSEDASTNPQSEYGRSKLLGEQRALAAQRGLVVRTSWLFGPGGPNFASTMLRLAASGRTPLRVVNDQKGAPTYTPFLARALVDAARESLCGTLHFANREPVTWYDFAREILHQAYPSVEVIPVSTDEFPRPAPRPAYSVLDTSRFFDLLGRRPEAWVAGLSDYLHRVPFEESPS